MCKSCVGTFAELLRLWLATKTPGVRLWPGSWPGKAAEMVRRDLSAATAARKAEDLVNQAADLPPSVPQRNRGRFQPGDARINREGRPPKGWNRARRADRLMCLPLSAPDVIHRITHEYGPWIVNMPRDTRVVECHWDAAEEVFMLVLRSSEFPLIARGDVIPEFRPAYNGLRWGRR